MATNGTSESPECQFDRDKIMADLDKKGYCVIPNVMTSEECDRHIAAYREWVAQFGNDNWPFQRHSIIQSYRIGHFQPTWETRLSTKKVFETVWQTKKLLTSFDGVAISPPPEEDNQGFATPGSAWLHLDQSSKRRGLHCYQGAAYLEESSDTDYCFRVLEGSHKHTDDFYDEHEAAAKHSARNDFFKLRDEHITWFKREHGCPLTKVPVPKGGFVLWDSRLVHDNCRPEPDRPNSERWRFVVFVCMGPARWAGVKDLAEKRQAYKSMRLTSHWPVQSVSMFPERAAADERSGVPLLTKLPEVARSEEARMLAGVAEYDFEDGEPNGPDWDPEWRN